ncbi:AsnC family protein [Nonomuraea sp. NPDC049269]|uniref:AsnC family protein n=1 Tax=Nonomuraea sp. NPDC049269 TaxID=3364349 RepID=UPI003720831E
MDELDRAIVHALHVDGRAPFSRIASVLEVSDAAGPIAGALARRARSTPSPAPRPSRRSPPILARHAVSTEPAPLPGQVWPLPLSGVLGLPPEGLR